MKRRTLIWGSILAIVAPVRAAFVSRNFKNETDNSVDPYDAVKIVYDNFITDGSLSEIEFDEPAFSESLVDYYKVHCKLVASDGGHKKIYNTWLVFSESLQEFPGRMMRKKRELKIVQVLIKGAHDLVSSKPYSVEEILKIDWKHNSKTIVSVGELHYNDSVNKRMETCPIFKVDDVKNINDLEIVALSEFFSLITG
jgi:hypothetical protein